MAATKTEFVAFIWQREIMLLSDSCEIEKTGVAERYWQILQDLRLTGQFCCYRGMFRRV